VRISPEAVAPDKSTPTAIGGMRKQENVGFVDFIGLLIKIVGARGNTRATPIPAGKLVSPVTPRNTFWRF
jgi:hypothetical protein